MKGYRELTTWEDVWSNFNDVRVSCPTDGDGGFIGALTKDGPNQAIELPLFPGRVIFNQRTFAALNPAFKFWVRDEWRGRVQALSRAQDGTFVEVPSAFAGETVEVYVRVASE